MLKPLLFCPAFKNMQLLVLKWFVNIVETPNTFIFGINYTFN